ncbi:MarC family protein [Candidatus Protochlamydia phocaeensis]|uniref:MarC family protein n=1 Tax=Candidatus Protochlamydia phocaeensis TaxID=1414722 RepID=UPI000AA66469|nr:MarC family protein [Candidatus Protochlamydia phocaeensis]
MTILQLAMIFFIVTNPIGNCPTIIALIKDHTIREQQKILFREAIFSMILAIFFLFLGETFLSNLNIQNYALTVSGGILLFLVALKMIFSNRTDTKTDQPKQDPFIVPIATPLLSGAGLLTMIMLYSKQESNDLKILFAILIAWIGVTGVLVAAPYLQVFLGKRGLAALEQLMGMLLAMIAMEMIVQGSSLFLTALSSV